MFRNIYISYFNFIYYAGVILDNDCILVLNYVKNNFKLSENSISVSENMSLNYSGVNFQPVHLFFNFKNVQILVSRYKKIKLNSFLGKNNSVGLDEFWVFFCRFGNDSIFKLYTFSNVGDLLKSLKCELDLISFENNLSFKELTFNKLQIYLI